jgi:GNAT superfamily N-acetyltransferase
MSDQDLHITMIRPNLRDYPRAELPEGFALRTYQPGDEAHWVTIHELADPDHYATLETFEMHFSNREALADRMFYLTDPGGETIGTATAWWSPDYYGKNWGLVHWVAIVPEYQGQGLAKPLLTRVLDRLARSHERCFLVTASQRIPAIQLYLNYGFHPCYVDDTCPAEWEKVRLAINHPLLFETPLTYRDL